MDKDLPGQPDSLEPLHPVVHVQVQDPADQQVEVDHAQLRHKKKIVIIIFFIDNIEAHYYASVKKNRYIPKYF